LFGLLLRGVVGEACQSSTLDYLDIILATEKDKESPDDLNLGI